MANMKKLQELIKVQEDFQFLPIAQGNQFRDKIQDHLHSDKKLERIFHSS
jgi:hypothetical protein